jgi:hypothetical protein
MMQLEDLSRSNWRQDEEADGAIAYTEDQLICRVTHREIRLAMAKPRIMFYHDERHPLIYMYEPPMLKDAWTRISGPNEPTDK